ncbi:MAG: 2-C-methyl-D-erythritol 4-phosphate cytidylyltransferase [Ignavibacteria bacterium]
MKERVFVIIAAAGSGTRLKEADSQSKKSHNILIKVKTKVRKAGLPKQFLKLKNKPVILHSLIAFQNSRLINSVIIAARKEYFSLIKKLSIRYKITKIADVVEGGSTRFESVKKAFARIKANEKDVVLIHDGARPFIDSKSIERIVLAAKKFNAVIFGRKIYDTVKRGKRGYVSKTLDRENLWMIQTPQAFRYKILKSAYRRNKNRRVFTDESALLESAGFKVKIIGGSLGNVKITRPQDLEVMKKII